MSFDSSDECAGVPGADDGSGGDEVARLDATITVGEDEFVLGEVDIEQARGVLADLGARGSRALSSLSVGETIAMLRGLQKLSGAVAAVQARALVHLEQGVKQDCLDRGETPTQAVKIARAEAGEALKSSKAAAGQSMSSCRRLVQSMPGMLTALAQGRMVAASTHEVGKTMGTASPALREKVDEVLAAHLGSLEDCGPGEWGDEAERVLHTLDPAGAAARHKTARQERNVSVRRDRHGMATITARVPGLDAARIHKGLSLAAEKARAGGDRRGHQQIMADHFTDALIGRGDGIDPSTLEIGVLVTDRSLLAPNHADAATVEGFGSVPFEHIRQEMILTLQAAEAAEDPEQALTLRKVFLDHEDGQMIALESRSRRFPPALARLIRYAHQTCRAPHCDAPIRQIDHIQPWARGGPTSLENANGVCVGDNQKEEAGQSARVVTDEHGKRRSVEWTTRYGQTSRRGGVNFDPVGTAQRELVARQAAEAEEIRHAAARHLAARRAADAGSDDEAHAAQRIVRETAARGAAWMDAERRAAETVAEWNAARADSDHALRAVIDELGAPFERNFARLDPALYADYHPRRDRRRRH